MKNSAIRWITLKANKEESKPMAPRGKTRVGRIHGGWLLKFMHFMGASSSMTSQSMVFLPDINHEWVPEDHAQTWERLAKRLTPNFNEWTDRLAVYNGWIYKDTFFNKTKSMHISLVFVPEQEELD